MVEYARTPSGRVVRLRKEHEGQNDEPELLGGKGSLTHEPRRTVGDRLTGTRPRTKIGWITRLAFPDHGESDPHPIKKKSMPYPDIMRGPRSGISKKPLFTEREKVTPVKRRIYSARQLQEHYYSAPEIK